MASSLTLLISLFTSVVSAAIEGRVNSDGSQILSVLVYRLLFHPLAKYPGPLVARLSAYANWYHAQKGDRHEWIQGLHAQYGKCQKGRSAHWVMLTS